MKLPSMEKPLERFDEVLAGIDVNWIEPQVAKQRIALLGLLACELFVLAAIGPAERVQNNHPTGLRIAKPYEADWRHLELALIGNHERDHVVFATGNLERPL